MKKVNKKDIKVIIGFIITGLCTLWITYSTYSNKYWYTGWTNMTLILSTGGIILGGFLMFFGIESKKSKGLFLIVSGSILIGIIIYLMGIMYISLMGIIILGLPIVMVIFGFILLFKPSKQKELKKIKYVLKQKSIERKMEAATNVTYMLRIEKEIGELGAERVNYICGYCGVKNNLKSIDEDHGIFQCLNCGAENHILK